MSFDIKAELAHLEEKTYWVNGWKETKEDEDIILTLDILSYDECMELIKDVREEYSHLEIMNEEEGSVYYEINGKEIKGVK